LFSSFLIRTARNFAFHHLKMNSNENPIIFIKENLMEQFL